MFELFFYLRLAGEWIPEQIVRSVATSKRTIVVLTENFLDSFWGKVIILTQIF